MTCQGRNAASGSIVVSDFASHRHGKGVRHSSTGPRRWLDIEVHTCRDGVSGGPTSGSHASCGVEIRKLAQPSRDKNAKASWLASLITSAKAPFLGLGLRDCVAFVVCVSAFRPRVHIDWRLPGGYSNRCERHGSDTSCGPLRFHTYGNHT
eukprot:607433-Amphidinium_carterae.1